MVDLFKSPSEKKTRVSDNLSIRVEQSTSLGKVHVQNFRGWQAVSLGGGVTVMEKRETLAGWVTKVCLKCTEKLG